MWGSNDHHTGKMRGQVAKPLIELERKLAAERHKASLPKKGQQDFQPASAKDLGNTGKAYEKVAERLGTSHETLRKAIKIIEEAPEELQQDVRGGRAAPITSTPPASTT